MAEDNCYNWRRVGCALPIVRCAYGLWWICICGFVSTADSRAALLDDSDLHTISDDHAVLIMRFAYAHNIASSIFMWIAQFH